MAARIRISLSFGVLAILAVGPARAQVIDVTAPGNPIVGIAATFGSNSSLLASVGTVPNTNNYPAAEAPPSAIDNIVGGGNKYLNFLETGAGFIVTPSAFSTLNAIRFATGNDATERDPMTVTIEGTNDANATTTLNSSWTAIYNGVSGLATDPGRDTFGTTVSFANTLSFASYRVLISSVRDGAAANSFQFGEIELLASAVPEPSSVVLLGLALGPVALRIRNRRAAG